MKCWWNVVWRIEVAKIQNYKIGFLCIVFFYVQFGIRGETSNQQLARGGATSNQLDAREGVTFNQHDARRGKISYHRDIAMAKLSSWIDGYKG